MQGTDSSVFQAALAVIDKQYKPVYANYSCKIIEVWTVISDHAKSDDADDD